MPHKVKNIPSPKNKFGPNAPARTLPPQLEKAITLHRQGRLKEAQALYEAILQVDPRHVDALHLLGVVAAQFKNHQLAVDLIGKAIAINPKNASFHSNLGNSLRALKQSDAAVASFDRAIRLIPDYAEAYFSRGNALNELKQLDAALASFDHAIRIKSDYSEAHSNRGNVLKALKQLDAALVSYDRAISLKPDNAETYYNRGNALQELSQFEAAVASYDRAISLKPDHIKAYSNRGAAHQKLGQLDAALASFDQAIRIRPDYAEAYSNRGNVLKELRQLDAALASYDHAISIKPDYAEAHSNRGTALRELKQIDASLASCRRAISIKPDYAEAHSNLGNALKDLRQMDAALASYDRAIRLKPDYAEAYYNRGIAQQELNQLDAAVASFDQAIGIKPDYANAYLNKGLALLLSGDFSSGWPLYEWRWKKEDVAAHQRKFKQPLWLGAEPLRGKTILLYGEQGLGDTLQFCRYARLVSAQGARVIVEVPKALIALLQGLEGVDAWIEKGTNPAGFDFHCPLLSLPLAFKTKLDTIPSHQAYLHSNTNKVAAWAGRLGARTKPLVGLVWNGSALHKNDQNRSVALSSLMDYLPDSFEYVSLQKELKDSDRATLEGRTNLKHYGDELDDFSDTAALCELMDIVIAVDTSVAHLSGALGKTTWVLLPYFPDWRWLLGRDDSPWYPSVKLYRQDADRDWAGVFRRVRADLCAQSA